MRISGGIEKGRKIKTRRLFSKASGEEDLRPTSSKVREALFDIIRNKIEGASFVDLFAGTGTVGFESLSRGARKVIFVEPNRLRTKAIKETGVQFGLHEQVTIFEGTAEGFLKKASAEKKMFDIFFVDPPYFSEETMRILPMVAERGLLNNGGIVVVEHFVKKKLPELVGKLKMIRNYRYGDTMLTIYKKEFEKIGGSGEENCHLSRNL